MKFCLVMDRRLFVALAVLVLIWVTRNQFLWGIPVSSLIVVGYILFLLVGTVLDLIRSWKNKGRTA